MYSTCLFCHSDLGANEVIESFPIGRRLAFDAAQGRLWVVCGSCERWNLTPIEERWEAVEQCEKLFSSTRLRVSSDNIGLSRLKEGLELVRIGKPQRPEMAAWRYGDQFGRRRKRYIMMSVAGGAALVGVFIAAKATGVIAGGGFGLWQLVSAGSKAAKARIVRARLSLPGQSTPSILRGRDMSRVMLTAQGDDWSLRVPTGPSGLLRDGDRQYVEVHGDDALRAASSLLPGINVKGGNAEEIKRAVRQLEVTPDPHELFRRAAGMSAHHRRVINLRRSSVPPNMNLPAVEIALSKLPDETSLALEMAAHEDIERRAMLGELSLLERAWREAEEIASISDSMLLPEGVEDQIGAMKKAE